MTGEQTPQIPDVPNEAPPAPTAAEMVVAASEPEPRRGPSLGQIVVGSFLVLVGIGWFLEAADIADIPWRALLPASLIVIGAALVFGARTARHGGIIALGVVLTVAVAAASAVEVLIDVPITGGVGEERTVVLGDIADEYRHALGSYTVDLRDGVVGPDGAEVEISIAIGELIVIVPPEATLDIDARAGIGEVVVFERRSAGLGADLEYRSERGQERVLTLDLDVAIGKVEVRR
jgi:hypothetical protein